MSEELSNELAQLAGTLGVSVGELWAWLTSEGMHAYARMRVSTLGVMVVGIVAFVAIGVAVTVLLYRAHVRSFEGDRYYEGGYAIAAIIVGGVTAFGSLFVIPSLSDLVGWMVSPEGMFMAEVLRYL